MKATYSIMGTAEKFIDIRFVNGKTVLSGSPSMDTGHHIPSHRGDQGVFASWNWDGHQLTVNNDRYGFIPLYYYASNNRVCLSFSIETLLNLGVEPKFDDYALSVFIRFGQFLGEDTAFENIRAIPPNTTFCWKPREGLKITSNIIVNPRRGKSRKNAIKEYVELFSESIKQRLPQEVFCIPLSGGRDSRHILFELNKLGYKPNTCITARHFPPKSNDDEKIAAFICQELGLEHKIVQHTLPRIRAEIRKNSLTNYCSLEHIFCLPIAEYIVGKFNTLYDGIGGDVLSAGLKLNKDIHEKIISKDYPSLIKSIFSNENATLNLLAPEVRQWLSLDKAIDRITPELEKHTEAASPYSSFLFWNRTRRNIALVPFSIFRELDYVFAPYLDHDLFDFFTSLPPEIYIDHKFHTDTILSAYPEHKDIPFEQSSPSTSIKSKFYLQLSVDTLKYIHRNSSFILLNKKFAYEKPLSTMLLSFTKKADAWWMRPLIYLTQLEMIQTEKLK